MVMYFGVPDKEEIYLGDDDTIAFTIYTDEDHTSAKNITGATFKYTVKERATDTSYVFQNAGSITDAANGELDVDIADTDTNSLAAGKYAVDLEMALGGGVYTCFVGYLDIWQDVT
jgi:hypothetical protein